jgi:hypothetical protein
MSQIFKPGKIMPKEADSLWILVQTRNGMSAESRSAKCVIAARTAAEGDWLGTKALISEFP